MIKRGRETQNFTVITNEIFENINDLCAIGILTYLLSKPENFEVYKKDLYKKFKQGRIIIDQSFNLLVEKGYITGKKRIDKENGKFIGHEWIVYSKPMLENRLTENAQSETRDTVNRLSVTEQSIINTNNISNILYKEIINNKEIEKEKKTLENFPKFHDDEFMNLFEQVINTDNFINKTQQQLEFELRELKSYDIDYAKELIKHTLKTNNKQITYPNTKIDYLNWKKRKEKNNTQSQAQESFFIPRYNKS